MEFSNYLKIPMIWIISISHWFRLKQNLHVAYTVFIFRTREANVFQPFVVFLNHDHLVSHFQFLLFTSEKSSQSDKLHSTKLIIGIMMMNSPPQTYLFKVWWVAFSTECRQFFDYFLLNDYSHSKKFFET